MRYEFYGRKTTQIGKTLWEILGNLKNFGVGRLVRKSISLKYQEPSFIKINKVFPLPPPKSQFHNRKVMVWIDEYFNGRKISENELWRSSYFPMYQLIPKLEEKELYKRLEECKEKLPKRQIHKYWCWPPLYKKLWDQAASKDSKIPPLPKLKIVHKPYPEDEIAYIDNVKKPFGCDLYKTDASVEEKFKEIVRLKKLINAKSLTKD